MLAKRRQAKRPVSLPIVILSTAGSVERSVGKSTGKQGPKGMWAALADSDTETDTESVSVPVAVPVAKAVIPAPAPLLSAAEAEAMIAGMFADDPFFAAMERGDIQWGDMLTTDTRSGVGLTIPVTPTISSSAVDEDDEEDPLRSLWANPSAPLRAKEAEIWEQPFSTNLEEYWSDAYDTRAMSDEDYHALMGWIFSKGWYVDHYDRAGVRTWQDNAPARRWDPETMAPEDEHHVRWAEPRETRHACGGAGHSHSHSHSHGRPPSKPKGGVTIPRFCREGHACSATGGSCRYVHGDTIPRMDEPCSFGAGCGASDPTGVKRSQCLRMHPGETWTAELVIRRI
jgi:hypothetical protein